MFCSSFIWLIDQVWHHQIGDVIGSLHGIALLSTTCHSGDTEWCTASASDIVLHNMWSDQIGQIPTHRRAGSVSLYCAAPFCVCSKLQQVAVSQPWSGTKSKEHDIRFTLTNGCYNYCRCNLTQNSHLIFKSHWKPKFTTAQSDEDINKHLKSIRSIKY